MRLSEAAFTVIVDAGCPKCASKRCTVETYVAQRSPLLAGESYGSAVWAYKGEDLVHGTYRIACADCAEELFTDPNCPRCDGADKLATALEAENDFPLPTGCTSCGSEQINVTAYVPAEVVYEGKRGAKARSTTTPEDAGYHGFRAECRQCKQAAERRTPCPICGT